jgi:hypothetical protein
MRKEFLPDRSELLEVARQGAGAQHSRTTANLQRHVDALSRAEEASWPRLRKGQKCPWMPFGSRVRECCQHEVA